MKKLLAYMMLLLMIIGLMSCNEETVFTEKPKVTPIAMRGVYDIDGNSYLPTMDGGCITLKGDIESAYISPDRKTVCFIDAGKLIYQIVGADEKNVIQTDVETIIAVRDKGLVYQDVNNRVYRYLFGGEPMSLGEAQCLVADDNLNLSVAYNNSVYYLEEISQDKTKIGSYNKDIELLHVTNQGKVVWADQSSSTENIMLYENGESVRIGTYDLHEGYFSSYSTTQVVFDLSEQYMVVKNYYSNIMYQKKSNEEPQKVTFASETLSRSPLTAKGWLTTTDYVDNDGVFILVNAGDNESLYWVSKEGESEKMLSNVKDVVICGGYIFYINEDSNLLYGKFEGAEIKNEEKAASDASELGILSGTRGTVYFFKNYGYSENIGYNGTLYVFTAGDESPVKVSNDCYDFIYDDRDNTILFCSDVQRLDASVGTLYSYSLGKDTPEKIASDVITNTVVGGLRYMYIDKEAYVYKKYSSKIGESIYYNMYFYNGNESVLLAKEVTDSPPKRK